MKIKRIFSRLIFHVQKRLIKLISYFNHRLYMKFYLKILKKQGMKITGVPRYIGYNSKFDDINLISLGDRVVISDECHFLTHDYSITTALIAIDQAPEKDIALIRGIEIGNNVFIGKKTIVMPNTSVGDDVIVGAGTVLRGKIPKGSIVIGNPSEVIGSIYDQAEKWSKYLTSDLIRKD